MPRRKPGKKGKAKTKRVSPLAHLARKVESQGMRLTSLEHRIGRGRRRKVKRTRSLYSPAVESGVVYED